MQKWIVVIVLMLAAIACGTGAESEAPRCYVLHQNSKVSSTVCDNNTEYDMACLERLYGGCGTLGGKQYVCVYVRGVKVGVSRTISGCMKGCYRYALDNYSCCDVSDPGGDVENWSCN